MASQSDYGTDAQVADSGLPPAAGTVPPLVIPPTTLGQIQAQTYGAIVLHAPSLFVELTGGSGSTTYDVRTICKAGTAMAINGLVRYAEQGVL